MSHGIIISFAIVRTNGNHDHFGLGIENACADAVGPSLISLMVSVDVKHHVYLLAVGQLYHSCTSKCSYMGVACGVNTSSGDVFHIGCPSSAVSTSSLLSEGELMLISTSKSPLSEGELVLMSIWTSPLSDGELVLMSTLSLKSEGELVLMSTSTSPLSDGELVLMSTSTSLLSEGEPWWCWWWRRRQR